VRLVTSSTNWTPLGLLGAGYRPSRPLQNQVSCIEAQLRVPAVMPADVNEAVAAVGAALSIVSTCLVMVAFAWTQARRHGLPCENRKQPVASNSTLSSLKRKETNRQPSDTDRQHSSSSSMVKTETGDGSTSREALGSAGAATAGHGLFSAPDGKASHSSGVRTGSNGTEVVQQSSTVRKGRSQKLGRVSKRRWLNRAGLTMLIAASSSLTYAAAWVLKLVNGGSLSTSTVLWEDAVLRGWAAPGFFWAAGMVLATWNDSLGTKKSTDATVPWGCLLISMFLPCYLAAATAVGVAVDAADDPDASAVTTRLVVEKCLVAGRVFPAAVAMIIPLAKGFKAARSLLRSQVPATRRAGAQTVSPRAAVIAANSSQHATSSLYFCTSPPSPAVVALCVLCGCCRNMPPCILCFDDEQSLAGPHRVSTAQLATFPQGQPGSIVAYRRAVRAILPAGTISARFADTGPGLALRSSCSMSS